MRGRWLVVCSVSAVSFVASASVTSPASNPQVRRGFWLGFGGGFGSANATCDACLGHGDDLSAALVELLPQGRGRGGPSSTPTSIRTRGRSPSIWATGWGCSWEPATTSGCGRKPPSRPGSTSGTAENSQATSLPAPGSRTSSMSPLGSPSTEPQRRRAELVPGRVRSPPPLAGSPQGQLNGEPATRGGRSLASPASRPWTKRRAPRRW